MVTIFPVVFIPALLCDARLYRDVIDDLGDLISADVLLSPLPCLVDSVTDILARSPEKFVLVGTSYGGNLALAIALAAPERVTALWLMGCDPGAAAQGGTELAQRLDQTPAAVFDFLSGLVVRKADIDSAATFRAMAESIGGPAAAAQARAVRGRADVSSRLGELTMPVLVTWGAEDALAAVDMGRRMADAIPHAQWHLIEHCGHLPTLERPLKSAALFRTFLAEQAA